MPYIEITPEGVTTEPIPEDEQLSAQEAWALREGQRIITTAITEVMGQKDVTFEMSGEVTVTREED